MTTQTLNELVGEFYEVVPHFSRVLSRREIVSERADDSQMCLRGYWTGDGVIYGCEKSLYCYDPSDKLDFKPLDASPAPVQNDLRPYLILSESTNYLFSHPLETKDLFRKNEELFLSEEEQKAVEEDVKSGKATKVCLANLDHPEGLRIKNSKDGDSYLQISACRLRYFNREKDYFNEEQKRLLLSVYGEPELQGRIMEESGVPFTQIHLLSAGSVENKLRDGSFGDRMFVRASWIDRVQHLFAVSLKAHDLDVEVRMRGALKHQPEIKLVYTPTPVRRINEMRS